MTTSYSYCWLRIGLVASVLLLLVAADAQTVLAQALGDVALREAERRKDVKSGRVYTDADLLTLTPPPSPPAAVPAESSVASGDAAPAAGNDAASAPGDAVSEMPIKPRVKRDEQYWRSKAQELRRHFARVTADIAANQSRLAEIAAGPQTPTSAREREVIAATLSRLQRDARFRDQDLTRLTRQAELAKVPEEWIR